jgi:predicted HD phosphohydrolase
MTPKEALVAAILKHEIGPWKKQAAPSKEALVTPHEKTAISKPEIRLSEEPVMTPKEALMAAVLKHQIGPWKEPVMTPKEALVAAILKHEIGPRKEQVLSSKRVVASKETLAISQERMVISKH